MLTMTNRERLQARLCQALPKWLEEEMQYQMHDIEHEGPYDVVDAFLDTEAVAEENASSKRERVDCHRILIDTGFYVPMTEAEIRATTTTRGRPWSFKLQGVAYRCLLSLSQWLEE